MTGSVQHRFHCSACSRNETLSVSGSTLISDCDLSIRTKKLFENARLKTVGNILEHRIYDLIKYRGFGAKSLSEIRGFVIKHNLSFDND